MFNKVTAAQKEKNCHKVLFNVKGKLAMIHVLQQRGMDIRITPECTHACACFDNLIDYNAFKTMIDSLNTVSA